MNTLVKAFRNDNLRFVDHPENKYDFGIVASDLAKALDSNLSGNNFARSVDYDYKDVHLMHTPGGEQELLILWEPGVYQVLARSRKQKAKMFQKWLFEEVLPSIRATGSYSIAGKKPALQSTEDKEMFAEKLIRLARLLNELDTINERPNPPQPKSEPVRKLRYAGVVDMALAQGLPITTSNRPDLDRYVKNRIGELAKTKEVYVGDSIVPVSVYPDVSFMHEMVAQFFTEKR